jgi:hypothetical protein
VWLVRPQQLALLVLRRLPVPKQQAFRPALLRALASDESGGLGEADGEQMYQLLQQLRIELQYAAPNLQHASRLPVVLRLGSLGQKLASLARVQGRKSGTARGWRRL